jgi:putative Mn2+ efflux pump MntP
MMSFGAILLLSMGLAMDAVAVSAARGLAARRILLRDAAIVALAFGGFQALMPVLGWFLGTRLGPVLQGFQHWVAFLLLAGIGAKMVWEATTGAPSQVDAREQLFGFKVMVALGIATSIDAFAAGISLPLMQAPLLSSVVTIGVVTATSSVAALYLGRRFGAVLGRRADLLGGLVLVGIGGKFLLQHWQ